MKKDLIVHTTLFSAILLCTAATAAPRYQIIEKRNILTNETAYIPSQCYTKTEDSNGTLHNPCYVCHARSVEPNYINDHDLQLEYSFPEAATTNPWKNLFEDRRARIADISDTEIFEYIRTDNYLEPDGSIKIQAALNNPPEEWDINNNQKWDGYSPDCYFNFDANGFDKTPSGEFTGWRAFGYHPLPSTFWPTNGSTDDVSIRLPESFRVDLNGIASNEVYQINLAIVESLISRKNVAIPKTDEKKYGVDLDQNGLIDLTNQITFNWPASDNRSMSYVGLAQKELKNKKIKLAAGLFPEGTEFLQSVRYLDSTADGAVTASPRMKELRYMKKRTWQTYAELEEAALGEMKERDDFPDRINQFIGTMEQGVNNGAGWILQGFIEDKRGELRPQTYEETVYCAGCHGGLGTTADSVFSFARKLNDANLNYGWFQWDSQHLNNLQEPKTELRHAGVFYEYSYYLMYNSSGNEFRSNSEVESRYTNPDGSLKYEKLLSLQEDVSQLLVPSHKRALALNKAYKTIVEDQNYILGRDVNIEPAVNVHKEVEQDLPTGISKATSPVAFGNHFGLTTVGAEIPPSGLSAKSEAVFGDSMEGPDGTKYEADWRGIMHKSSYSSSIKGTRMVFPDRITLPTRPIIPTSGNPSCQVCHREVTGRKIELHGRLTDKGINKMAKVSPRSQTVAFVSNRTGNEQIFLMNSDGSGEQLLTSSGKAADTESHSWPNWNHAGNKLLYVGYDEAADNYSIKEYDFTLEKETVLLTSEQKLDRPEYHPHKDVIAYAALEGDNWDIWLLDENREKIRLTSAKDMDSNPLWSPDGSAIAYKVAPAGEYGLTGQNFLTFENGYNSPTIHVWEGPESVQMNDWSPDGSKIAYTAETISNSSGREKVSYMAFVSDLELKGNKAIATNTRIISQGKTLGDRGPVFSPDGSKILFWGWSKDFQAHLWLYNLETDITFMVNLQGDTMYPQWLDNEIIVFEAKNGEMTQLHLGRINSGPSEKLAVN